MMQDTYWDGRPAACRLAQIPESKHPVLRASSTEDRTRLRIREIARVRVRYDYRQIQLLLNRDGGKVKKNWVYRLYKKKGLPHRSKPRK